MVVNSGIRLFNLIIGLSVMIPPGPTIAQELSNKKVTLAFESLSTLDVLEQINALDGIRLSYNPDVVDNQKVGIENYVDTPVSDVLDDVLGALYDIKYRGSYIIIQIDMCFTRFMRN